MDISIIICTYNPDTEIFDRVLKAVAAQNTNALTCEVVLVDNASTQSVFTRFRPLLDLIPFPVKEVYEPKSGLTNARIAGFKAAEGSLLVFFDDDNEPKPDYIQQVATGFAAFPNVGVFGPGHISVQFLGNPPAWIHFNKNFFQERHYDRPYYACADMWFDFYPPGTGQSMRRAIFEQYFACVEAGTLTSSDRTGKSLSSAGDVQLVFEAVKSGYAVGVFPGLQVNHLISERKCTFSYLKRLNFGMAVSYPEAYAESYPHTRKVLPFYTNWQIFKQLYDVFWLRMVKKRSYKAFVFLVSERLGRIYGSNHARGGNTNSFWFGLINFLNLK